MYGGGDGPEDVLLGLVFGMTDPELKWRETSIKQVQVFTDNPFHYDGDGVERGGNVRPPM